MMHRRINESTNQRINEAMKQVMYLKPSLRQGVSRNPEVLGGWAGFVYSSIRLFVYSRFVLQ